MDCKAFFINPKSRIYTIKLTFIKINSLNVGLAFLYSQGVKSFDTTLPSAILEIQTKERHLERTPLPRAVALGADATHKLEAGTLRDWG